MKDTRITLLSKGGEHLYISFSPSRERLAKEIRVDNRTQARDTSRGGLAKYRGEIKRSVKWGWKIESTDQTDL